MEQRAVRCSSRCTLVASGPGHQVWVRWYALDLPPTQDAIVPKMVHVIVTFASILGGRSKICHWLLRVSLKVCGSGVSGVFELCFAQQQEGKSCFDLIWCRNGHTPYHPWDWWNYLHEKPIKINQQNVGKKPPTWRRHAEHQRLAPVRCLQEELLWKHSFQAINNQNNQAIATATSHDFLLP